jgi:capsular polysaccharide transport system permease protein
MITVIVTFILPMLGSVGYYGMIASPGYVSEVRFIVRSSAPLLSRDRYSSETVEPKAKIVQDTAVLLNYLESPAIIQDLQKTVDLQKMFGRDDIDILSRLSSDTSQDDLLKYWKRHYSASVNPKSGIVELRVIAFTPNEANDLVTLIMKLAEQQVNRLNSGMWDSLLASTQRDVDSATKEVADLRARFRDVQNQTGVYDLDLSAQSIMTILTEVEGRIAELKSRRSALSRTVKEGAPQLSDLDRQLVALEEQSADLKAKTAGKADGTTSNLAQYSSEFDQLKLSLTMAESKLTAAIRDVEKAKLVSSLQLVYVDNFTDPSMPDTSTYPRVTLNIFLTFLACVAACGIACGLLTMVRNKLD